MAAISAPTDGVLVTHVRIVAQEMPDFERLLGKAQTMFETPVRETKSTTPDPFVQPTGAADAYKKGDRVTFEGAVWESVIDANVWSPSAYPAGWKAV